MAKRRAQLHDDQIDLVIELAEASRETNRVLVQFCEVLQQIRPCTECSGAIQFDGDTICMVCFDDLINILSEIRHASPRKKEQVNDVIRYGKYLSEIPTVLYDFCEEHCQATSGNSCTSCPGLQSVSDGPGLCPREYLDEEFDEIYDIVDELKTIEEHKERINIIRRET